MDQLDERCSNNYVASVEIPNGVVCYDGSSTGAEAVYFCNDGYQLEGERRRVCQSDGLWNGSVPTCDIIASTLPPSMLYIVQPYFQAFVLSPQLCCWGYLASFPGLPVLTSICTHNKP